MSNPNPLYDPEDDRITDKQINKIFAMLAYQVNGSLEEAEEELNIKVSSSPSNWEKLDKWTASNMIELLESDHVRSFIKQAEHLGLTECIDCQGQPQKELCGGRCEACTDNVRHI